MKQNTQILDLQKNQSCRPQIEIVKAMLKLVKKMYFCAQDTIILVRLLCYINRYKVQGLLVYSILKIILNTQMLSSNYKDQEYGVFRSLGTFTWLSNLLRWTKEYFPPFSLEPISVAPVFHNITLCPGKRHVKLVHKRNIYIN